MLERRGLAALVALVAGSALVTGVVVWRARPAPLPAPAVVTGDAGPGATDGLIVVDVAGAVRRPGVVRLRAGARVVDAIAAAGGLRPGAVAGVNLARRLVDGEQVVVGATTGSAPGARAAGKLDLNSATAVELEQLPGVGPVLAQRIVAWREAHGRFATVEQLRQVSGIGERIFGGLRDLVTV